MDPEFMRKRFWFVISSVSVPVVVFAMVIASYESYVWLLTIFFSMASIHALHQLVWISEAYTLRTRVQVTWWSRAIDYGVVFSSLYPIAVWKMARREFLIGPMSLKFNDLLGGQYWAVWLVFGFFIVMVVLFVAKTIYEHAHGAFNLPKTLLIGLTASLMFLAPAIPNMDTAFQGINVWHSFQYLALTWYANRIREQRTGRRLGFLHLWEDLTARARAAAASRQRRFGWAGFRGLWLAVLGTFRKVDRDTGWSTFYMLCLAMLPISGVLILAAGAFWPEVHGDLPGSDEAYTYMGILSILLVHYVHDALLFTDHHSLVENE
jgi:hypothetical protein